MPEYIERENAYKLIIEQKEKETGMYSKGRNMGLNIAKSIIHDKERCPTVDVVEVVRCKDCKFAKTQALKLNGEELRKCDLHKRPCFVTDFCSYGELKELNDNA